TPLFAPNFLSQVDDFGWLKGREGHGSRSTDQLPSASVDRAGSYSPIRNYFACVRGANSPKMQKNLGGSACSRLPLPAACRSLLGSPSRISSGRRGGSKARNSLPPRPMRRYSPSRSRKTPASTSSPTE